METITRILIFLFAFHISYYTLSANNCAEINTTNTCQEQDYIALRALYLSTQGDDWNDNTGWLTRAEFNANSTMPEGTDVSTWYGVVTNAEGCVTELDLEGNGTEGSLPSEIGNLTQLERLNLSYNYMIERIPPEIGNLTNLTYLDLQRNRFSSWLPPEIGNLTNLTVLNLDSNELEGAITAELGNLINLTVLNLRGNRFGGAIPTELSNLTNLTYLNLSKNRFSVPIIPELGNLTNLTVLNLGSNRFEGPIPPELGNLTNLTYLNISNGKLTGSIPPELGNLTNLEFLLLYINDLTGTIPPELSNLNNLTHIDLANNKLTANIPPELGDMDSLKVLCINNNNLSGSIPPELGNMDALESLYLNNNWLTGSIPPELGNLSNLELMDLYYNGLSGSIPPELGNLTKLGKLNIFNNQLSGSLPPELGNMASMYDFLAYDNMFSGEIPTEFGNLTYLVRLNLSNNQLTGNIPASLGDLPYLGYLFLNNNQLSGCYDINLLSLCSQLTHLEANYSRNEYISDGNNFDTPWQSFCASLVGTCNCEYLDYRHLRELYLHNDGDNWANNTGWLTADEFRANPNMPAGTDVSTWYGVTTNEEGCVTELRLSNNQLSGSIYTSLQYLENLTHIDLSDNQLTGGIPTQFANLENLTSLLLSGNQLSGSIPMELASLSNLTDLHLAHNQLSGCYDINLMPLCGQVNIPDSLYISDGTLISDGNNFDMDWATFCYLDPIDTGQCPDCREQDYMGLRALYLSSNGDDWWGYDDWLTAEEFLANPTMPAGTDVSTWSGVTTNDYGCVTGVRVYRAYTAGTIPPEISYLTNLRSLSLIYMKLTDSIPTELLDLKNLEVLDLSRNNLTGNIPVELTELSNLKQLNLSSNDFTGNFPIEYTEFPHLEVLNLGAIPFGGNILPEIKNLTSLKQLILNGNQFEGEIPLEITELPNLNVLNLSYNNFTGNIPPELENLTDLNVLRLERNGLTGSIPAELGKLTNLNTLILEYNELTGSIPAELGNLTKLTYLDFKVSYNQLSGCYDSNLMPLCPITGNGNLSVSQGNDFSNTWYNFCYFQEGVDIPVNLKVLLEGAYDPTLGEMTTTLNTERGLLPGQTPANSLITPTPAGHPYNAAPWNYTGTEGTDWTDDSYSADAVDWVLVSLRSDITKDSEKARAAGILNKDGTITLPDRCNLSVNSDSVYIVVEHRNHVGVMSPQPIPITDYTLNYDFTQGNSYDGNATGAGQKELGSGVWGMYVGDADQASDANSYDINGSDKTPWVEDNGTFDTYAPTDFNMDGDVIGADKAIWFENYGTSSRVPK